VESLSSYKPISSADRNPEKNKKAEKQCFFVTVRAGTAYRKIWRLALSIKLWRWIGEWTDRVLHSILLYFASEFKWSRKMRLLSVFYFSFEISIACWLLSRPNWRIVSKLTDVVTYCTEASNQKSKYAYLKIFFYKKTLPKSIHWAYAMRRPAVPLSSKNFREVCLSSVYL